MNGRNKTPPEVYNISAGIPFVDALAAGISAKTDGEAIALAAVTVLLPTRRACRALGEAFLRLSGGRPLLLPKLMPLGDIDEDELAFASWQEMETATGAISAPQAVSGLKRLLLLTRLILAKDEGQTTPDQAARLAGVNDRFVKAATYVMCGLGCAIAAVIFVAMISTAEAASHKGIELDVIASVIVGGTALGGGSGGLMFTVTGVLLWQLPRVIATSRGVYDGAILPAGLELPRLALSVPLFVSAALILLTALLDLAKMAAGMPENVTDHHPEI